MKTLVIIPTYNERDNVRTVADATLSGHEQDRAILIVDDASPDGTGDVADELAAARPANVFVMHRPTKSGLGSAYLDGFRWGIDHGYDALCEMDADGQHDPAALASLIAAVERGADLAIGSRRIEGGGSVGWSWLRNLMSESAMGLTRWALGIKTRDVTAGFRCYRADAAAYLLKVGVESHGYSFQEEATFWIERSRRKVVEVPITFGVRKYGVSKLTPGEVLKFLMTIWRLRGKR